MGDDGANKAQGFYEWLDRLPEFERIVMIANSLRKQGGASAGSHHNLKPSLVRAFIKGVKYLDQASRPDYRVILQNGSAHYRGDPFTTFDMRTVFSGPGWVMSPSGQMYAGPHMCGGIHHSSFLAGAPVQSAGEIRANRGKIEFISAKSGHYMLTAEHLAWAIETLGAHQVDLSGTHVAVWPRSEGDGRVHLVSAPEFLRSSSQYNAWERSRGMSWDAFNGESLGVSRASVAGTELRVARKDFKRNGSIEKPQSVAKTASCWIGLFGTLRMERIPGRDPGEVKVKGGLRLRSADASLRSG